MSAPVNNVATFLRATNDLMLNYGIMPVPVGIKGGSLNFGRNGTAIKPPEKMIFTGTKIPLPDFMSFLPANDRPSEDDLDRQAVEKKRDVLSQWWGLQRFVNGVLSEMKEFDKPRIKAQELRKAGEQAEVAGLNVNAAWAFFNSAVILCGLGVGGEALAVELHSAARNFAAAKFHTSSAILYESAFNTTHSLEYATGAAEQWLQSVKQEIETETMRLRVDRGLIFAAYTPDGEVFRDLLRQSGNMYRNADDHFSAGADYLRVVWSLAMNKESDMRQWANIVMALLSARDVFEMKQDAALVCRVQGLLDLAQKV